VLNNGSLQVRHMYFTYIQQEYFIWHLADNSEYCSLLYVPLRNLSFTSPTVTCKLGAYCLFSRTGSLLCYTRCETGPRCLRPHHSVASYDKATTYVHHSDQTGNRVCFNYMGPTTFNQLSRHNEGQSSLSSISTQI
jgi:hypothetical protein